MGFDPVTMGAIALGTQVVGGVTKASSAYYGAKAQQVDAQAQVKTQQINAQAQKVNLETQAKLADVNARIYEMGAQSALLQGKQQVASLTRQAGALKGSQRAALAANGVDLNVGNAREAQASTDIMKTADMGTLKLNALRSAFGYRTQALNETSKAGMLRANAEMQIPMQDITTISPSQAAASSLLGSATQVASSWYGMSSSGVFSQSQPQYASIDALAADKGFW